MVNPSVYVSHHTPSFYTSTHTSTNTTHHHYPLTGRIMLRRTQADILQGHLPPRADFVVYCKLNRAQRAEYEHTAAEVKR